MWEKRREEGGKGRRVGMEEEFGGGLLNRGDWGDGVWGYVGKEMVKGNMGIVRSLDGRDMRVLGYDGCVKDVIGFGIE